MLDEISATLFYEWYKYSLIEPWGSEYQNLLAGLIASSIYNCNRASESDHLFDPTEFLIDFKGTQTQEQPWETMLSNAKIITQVYNSKK